ncbi:hydroxymethylglutaryl-CoA reductase, degradative [Streptococcus didelphis]|uniref:hydroxymethylglutaryl-CoA reductase, degradative n=1 Tax=Streptococcus didelphis TaxID=102886 RepID=UPI00036A0CD1|nr:hydroxymethylglutaryl-CoA reductase, degradative [Streptococcus didelphis]
MTSHKQNWSGFFKKSPEERQDTIRDYHLLSKESQKLLDNQQQLALEIANQMAENVIGRLSLPFSIVPNVLINNKTYHLPYVTEEPSVVAAASFAAKLIRQAGGFQATLIKRQMIGQVALYDVPDFNKAQASIQAAASYLMEMANQAYPSIVKRGGGAKYIEAQVKENFLIVYLKVDTQEAMGANMINTMMEALIPHLEDLSKGKSLMAILSNYATESLVSVECSIPIRFLNRDKHKAQQLAQKIELASQLAQIDPYRAATHNKGIFNGIDALVLATGNDWRAIEAACHTFAAKDGNYKGLSSWHFDKEEQLIKGELTLPMPIATKGGSIGLNPSVIISHDLLENPSAKDLAQIIACAGLAQNFAALKALTDTGIQAGHMKLQAKSLALLSGASQEEIPPLTALLLNEKHMNQARAQELLITLRKK